VDDAMFTGPEMSDDLTIGYVQLNLAGVFCPFCDVARGAKFEYSISISVAVDRDVHNGWHWICGFEVDVANFKVVWSPSKSGISGQCGPDRERELIAEDRNAGARGGDFEDLGFEIYRIGVV
jgi:hypothetical protein